MMRNQQYRVNKPLRAFQESHTGVNVLVVVVIVVTVVVVVVVVITNTIVSVQRKQVTERSVLFLLPPLSLARYESRNRAQPTWRPSPRRIPRCGAGLRHSHQKASSRTSPTAARRALTSTNQLRAVHRLARNRSTHRHTSSTCQSLWSHHH